MNTAIRQFNLIDSEGQAYTLTVANRYTGFLTSASGLGYEKTSDYQKIGNDYEPLTDNINQGVISGVIRFFNPHAYQFFSKFALFCQDKNLTLLYRTPTGEYRRKGSITKIEKSEGEDLLKVKIDFTATSLWYQELKRKTNAAALSVKSESVIESPCCLSFTGVTKSNATLAWSQSLNNTSIMTGELDGVTIAATDTVYIRTDTNPYQIYKVSSGGTKTDLYGKSDFGTKRFPMLYKGVNVFTVTGATEISIEGRVLYETV